MSEELKPVTRANYSLYMFLVPMALIMFGIVAIGGVSYLKLSDSATTVAIGAIGTLVGTSIPGILAFIKASEAAANTKDLSTDVQHFSKNVNGKMDTLLDKTGTAAFANGQNQATAEALNKAAQLAKETAELAVVAGDKAKAAEPTKSNAPDIPAEIKIVNEPDSPVPTIPGTKKED